MNTDKQLFGDSRLVNSVRSKNLYTTINTVTSMSKRIEGLANITAADNGKPIQKIDGNYMLELPAGAYDASGTLIMAWDDIVTSWGKDVGSSGIIPPTNIVTHIPSDTVALRIPGSVGGIGDFVFYGLNDKIKEVRVGEGCLAIGNQAFGGLSNATIYLPSTITSISDMAFNTASGLTIYAAFKSFIVGGAPWGAENSTVHYV